MNGYNPMTWECEKSGCFNKVKRPKIEMFHECFYGKISMSDIDAAVEVNGNFLFIEWKSGGGKLKLAQKIFFERLTRHANIGVFIVSGDAETMRIDGYSVISGGVHHDVFVPCDLDGFRKVLRDFNDWAVKNPCTEGYSPNE